MGDLPYISSERGWAYNILYSVLYLYKNFELKRGGGLRIRTIWYSIVSISTYIFFDIVRSTQVNTYTNITKQSTIRTRKSTGRASWLNTGRVHGQLSTNHQRAFNLPMLTHK